jgi:hypothetical protein
MRRIINENILWWDDFLLKKCLSKIFFDELVINFIKFLMKVFLNCHKYKYCMYILDSMQYEYHNFFLNFIRTLTNLNSSKFARRIFEINFIWFKPMERTWDAIGLNPSRHLFVSDCKTIFEKSWTWSIISLLQTIKNKTKSNIRKIIRSGFQYWNDYFFNWWRSNKFWKC